MGALLRECFPSRASDASSLLREFSVADHDGDGRCDFGEFARYYAVLKEDYGTSTLSEAEIAQLRALFDRFDTDSDGSLDEKELATLLQQCFPSRAKNVKRLMQEFTVADLNGDGKVSFDEFLRYHEMLKEHGTGTSGPGSWRG